MSDCLEIGGKFGVEIYDNKTGKLVEKKESHNIVVNGGLKQITRWLDRAEYVTENPAPTNWKDVTYCAGEARRITILPKATFDGEWHEYDGFHEEKMFDLNSSTYSYHWHNQNATEYLYVYFDEPFDLKQIGILGYFHGNYWDTVSLDHLYVQQDGYTVADAGSTDYNDDEYIIMTSSYNNHRVFKSFEQEYYIFVNDEETEWHISSSIGGSPVYRTSDTTLPEKPSDGTWTIDDASGTSPAPTVTNETTDWRKPFLLKPGYEREANPIYVKFYNNDPDSDEWYDKSDEAYMGKRSYCTLSFECFEEFNDELSYYGFIPDVKNVKFQTYVENWDVQDNNAYILEMHFHEAVMHPQNPCTLKLGTDDGTTLPLAMDNDALGAFSPGMKWKAESVSQTDYTVRFTKRLGPDDANGVEFKEIGLFGNLDGHTTEGMSEPTLENDNGLFARSIFNDSWSKTEEQTAVIYYEISVDAGVSSSSSSSSSSST